MKKIELLFGTTNIHKIEEFQEALGDSIKIIDMESQDIQEELMETRNTIEGNARQKVDQLQELYHGNCFSEDTGLCIPALNGAPGVKSARYAGDQKNDCDNMDKLLTNLKGKNRSAYFLTVIALSWEANIFTFTGKCSGQILENKRGTGGFGYDPIFLPEGENLSFAEMSMHRKNIISHRAKAVKAFNQFLNQQVSNYQDAKK